jgi:fibronectin type 3 domain-containing protein
MKRTAKYGSSNPVALVSRKLTHRHPVRKTFRPSLEWLESRLAPANVDVLSFHNDLSLTGANLGETTLNLADVNPTQFGKLFSQTVDGYVYAEPLYKANLAIPGQGTHNVAFVATEHDSVYAFDADSNTGANANPLWFHSFLDPGNAVTTIPSPSVVSNSDIVPEIGITGTPVIDGSTSTLYVVAATLEIRNGAAHYVQKLHALDITTGNELTAAYRLGDTIQGGAEGGWTNVSDISVNGVGDGSSGGVIRFNAARENNRSGLQIVNGVVYVAFASHSDFRPYTGWVLGFNAQTLQPVKVFNTSPNSGGNGMWESGSAISADAQGNLYFAVGNGFAGPQGQDAFNPTLGNWSESVLKLSTTGNLTVVDYFTPHEWRTLDSQDADLGSGGAMLLPDSVGSADHPHLMVELGKSGKLYLIDRDTGMGHINNPGPDPTGGPDLIVQTVTAGQAGVWGNPTFLQLNPTTGIIYYHGSGDVMKGYLISNGHIDDTPADIMRSPATNTFSNFPGTQPVISANGVADPTNPTDAIVWELQVDNFGGGTPMGNRPLTGPGFLRALKATDLNTVLYDSGSSAVGQRDLFGEPVKFTMPTVTNGHVLVGEARTFSVFGLFPEATALPPPRENLAAEVQVGIQGPQIHLTWTNPGTGADPTNIRIERSTDGTNFSPVTNVFRFNSDFTDLGPFEYRQHYFYRVVATNQLGDSAPSNTTDVIIVIAPATLTVTGTGTSSIGLSWTGVANDHYDIERSNDGTNFTRIATVNAVQTSYTDTGLAPGQYTYHIHAVNVGPDGESLSNVQAAWVGPVIDHSTPHLAGFANATDLTVNGSTFVSPSEHVVRLTNGNNQTGSIFSNTRFAAGSFTTTFDVRLHEGSQPNYADGFTFDLQANSPTALGTGTAGIGYRGIGHSVAVIFSTFQHTGDPSSSWVGLSLNGAAPVIRVDTTQPPPGLLLNSQDIKQINLSYNGTTLTVRVQDVVQPELVFTTSFTVNIAQVIGSDTAYVGFTGASGSNSFWQLEDVVDWTFTSNVPVPGAPTNLGETAFTSSAIDLAWNSNSYNGTGFQVERSTDGTHFTVITTTTATSFEDQEVVPGVTYFYRVLALGGQGNSPYSNMLRAGLPSAPLSQDQDIGTANDPSVPGSVTFASGTYNVTASGSDIYGTADHFHYVYQPFLGDGEIVARVVSETATNPFTKAGIMFRETLAANAKKAFVFEFPATHGVPDQPVFNFRGQTGGTTTEVGGPANLPAPIWLRLVRSGSSISAYWAADNGDGTHNDWNQIGTTQTIIMSPNVYVGLALTSDVNGVVSTANFDHVAILPATLETTHLEVRAGSGANARTRLTITVQALDAYNNPVSGYRGTIHFTSSDPQAALPADYTFTSADNGTHTFRMVLGSPGRQTITVMDQGTPAILGGTVVTVISDPVASSLLVSGFRPHINGGEVGTFTVTALDATGSVLAGYRGTIHFSSTDLQAQLPADYTFTPGDNGSHTFTATLNAYGVQSITANDPTTRIASTQSGIQVAPAVPVVTGTTITATAGKTFGVAAGFDGTDDYVQVPSTLVVGGAITIEAWIKAANVFAAWARVIDFARGPDTDNIIFGWQSNSGHLYFETHQGTNTQMLIAPTVFPQNQWVHVAAVNDGNGMGFLYINGMLVASGPQLIPATETRTQQRVARSNYGGDAFFSGSMEELHVWSTVRSASQIQMDMNQLTGNEAGLVLYYPLDEASGNTAFDRTANHYNGTLTSTMGGDQPAWVADAGPGPRRVVASFTSANPAARASDFTVMIDWGDGHSSAGIVTTNGQGGFNVSGSNTYAAPATYSVTVTVTDTFGGAGMAQSTANVTATAPLFLVAGFPSSVQAGVPASFTVTALDAEGNVMTGYRGTVHFSSSDLHAQLPDDYMYTPDDNGVHTFTATLNTFGLQSITVTDRPAGITGSQRDIRVLPTPPVVTGTTVTATAGKTFGVAAGFDGTDDYIQVPSTLVVTGAITIEAWVKSANVFAPWARVIDFSNGPGMDNIIFGWQGGGGHLYFETYRNGTSIQLVSPTVFPQNQWVHVAAVNDGNGRGFLYINGVLVASSAQMIPANVTRTEQWVGRSAYASDAFFSGSMEELHVWSTVRSAADIQMDMNQLTGDEPGLVAYYPLDEASGTTAFDRTANHYDATLTSTGTGDQPAWVADAGAGPGRVVASFTSADPAARASDFTVTIDWGDGHISAGIVTLDGQGGFNVSGSNTYAAPGTYTITVTVTDAFGGMGMAQSTAEVVGPPAPRSGNPGGTWARVTPMPVQRLEPSPGASDGAISRTTASLLIATNYNAAAVAAGSVYAFGGPSNQVYAYNPANDAWNEPLPIHYLQDNTPAVAVIHNLIEVVGGTGPNMLSNELETYDPTRDIWTVLPE